VYSPHKRFLTHMSFEELKIAHHYDSDATDVLNGFYRPIIKNSVRYDRAVGYFSSETIRLCANEFRYFVGELGSIRLIVGSFTNSSDLDALSSINSLSDEEIREITRDHLKEYLERLEREDLDSAVVFCKMVVSGTVQLRFAFRNSGIYHEKYGIFYDKLGNKIAFSGSANETAAAITWGDNHESFSVYLSSENEIYARYGETLEKKFENLWAGHGKNTRIVSPDVDSIEMMRRISEDVVVNGVVKQELDAPTSTDKPLWPHQSEAIRLFVAGRRGILEMATGTGKTVTALAIIKRLVQSGAVSTVVISTVGNDLLRQWVKNLYLDEFIPTRLTVFEHIGDGRHQLNDFILSLSKGGSICVISFDNLYKVLRNLSDAVARETLLVLDEVHNIGSPSVRTSLSEIASNIEWKLGLSATPERDYDSDGNDFIESFVGPTLFSYDVADAISDGILSPFEYFPLEYWPSDEDRERIRLVYSRKAARASEGRPMSDAELFIELSKVYKLSLEKLLPFKEFVLKNPSVLERSIIFVETKDYGERVLDIIHRYKSNFHTYYEDDNVGTLRRFATGELDCLVTCHKVSEGIDIKSLQSVILFSSARARLETVQRIGRCLRVDPSNPGKLAKVVDFVRADVDAESSADNERRNWLTDLAKVRRKAR
jgi:superfamily II DNA or RNA helicase